MHENAHKSNYEIIIRNNDYRILSTQNQDLYLFIINYPIESQSQTK